MSVKFACIRLFNDKYKNHLKPINVIFRQKKDKIHITPQHLEDFDEERDYYVLWKNCDTKCRACDNCIITRARIACLGVSEEDAEQKCEIRNKRIKFPKKLTSSDSADPAIEKENRKKSSTLKAFIKTARNVNAANTVKKYQQYEFLSSKPPLQLINENPINTRDISIEQDQSNEIKSYERSAHKDCYIALPRLQILQPPLQKSVDLCCGAVNSATNNISEIQNEESHNSKVGSAQNKSDFDPLLSSESEKQFYQHPPSSSFVQSHKSVNNQNVDHIQKQRVALNYGKLKIQQNLPNSLSRKLPRVLRVEHLHAPQKLSTENKFNESEVTQTTLHSNQPSQVEVQIESNRSKRTQSTKPISQKVNEQKSNSENVEQTRRISDEKNDVLFTKHHQNQPLRSVSAQVDNSLVKSRSASELPETECAQHNVGNKHLSSNYLESNDQNYGSTRGIPNNCHNQAPNSSQSISGELLSKNFHTHYQHRSDNDDYREVTSKFRFFQDSTEIKSPQNNLENPRRSRSSSSESNGEDPNGKQIQNSSQRSKRIRHDFENTTEDTNDENIRIGSLHCQDNEESDNSDSFDNSELRQTETVNKKLPVQDKSKTKKSVVSVSPAENNETHNNFQNTQAAEDQFELDPSDGDVSVEGDSEGSVSDLDDGNEDFPFLKKYKPKLYKEYGKRGLPQVPDPDPQFQRYGIHNNEVSLAPNLTVGKKTWTMMNRKNRDKFLRELTIVIWKKKLPYLCLDKTKLKNKKLCGKKIKLVCPIKLELYFHIYKDFLDNNENYNHYDEDTKDILIYNSSENLTRAIRDKREKTARSRQQLKI